MALNTTYVPQRESDLLAWSNNLATKLEADPPGFGLTLDQGTEYKAVQTAFAAAYATANDPTTRTPPNIATKNTAKQAMLEATRPLVQTIQNWSGMTDAKRKELEIPVRDSEPTPIGPPTEMPVLRIAKITGRIFDLELRNQEDKRRRPDGARAAWLFTFVGDTPPTNLKQWQFEAGATKTNPQIVFPETVAPGTKIWVTALWVSPTDQPGPACAPVMDYTNHSGLSQAA